MFREDDFRYLCWFIALDLILSALSFCYEIVYGTGDSIFDAAIATLRWQGAVVPLTLTIIGTWEVGKVIASRIIARDREKAQQELQEKWEAWNRRRLEAEAKGQPFNDPPPSLSRK